MDYTQINIPTVKSRKRRLIMSKRAKQKFLNGCMAATVVLSTTLAPMVVNAATPDVPSAVTRIGGYDQYETAAKMAQKGWTTTSDSVVLSAGMNYSLVDALAAGPLAAKLKAPIILTDNGKTLNSFAKAELQRLKPTKAYITSGTAVIKQSVLDEITAMGITPVQLGGYDQYETSVNIAKEMVTQGAKISQVVLAAGYVSPADALSVAPIAAAQGIPVLTTTQGQLPASVKTYLDSIKANITDSYIVGGTAVVADAVKAKLPGTVTRYSGQTKYDTNVQILKGLAKNYKNKSVYVANGETLVDALAGVPLAAESNSPVVLVNQQLANSTRDFVKLNMSTTDMVALGGETVVSTAAMNTLTSATAYSTDSATEGSTDTTKPLELTDNVVLTGNKSTLTNATADYSVYVKGDNITLSNLTVKGTVFVDPGKTGSATLDGVKAENIVILSGASDSIHINNSSANVLTVDSSSNVHVEATGTTTINNTVVRTFAIVDANGGSMGQVTISTTPGQVPVVEFRGTFTQPVVVEGSATITAASGASIAQLTIAPQAANAQVTLAGNFASVNVNAQANVVLAANATVTNMTTNAKANIQVPPTARITKLTDVGNTGTLVSGGGQVNGQTTSTTPSAPPTGATSGGGGGGGGSSVITPSTPAPSVLSNTSVTVSGTQLKITADTSAFKHPNLKLDQNASMALTVSRGGTNYDLGTWALTNSTSGNDLFSVANAPNLNILETLTILKATGIQSSAIFNAIDFHAILTQAQTMDSTNKSTVYTKMADIFTQASNTSSVNAFYQALNLPGIYAAADANTQGSIRAIIAAAIPSGVQVTAEDLVGIGAMTSANAVAELNSQMNAFFSNINFQQLFDVLSSSTNKGAIFTAINFSSLYSAISTLPADNKMAVYLDAASLYQAAITLDTGNSIDYGALLGLIITTDNTVNMTISNNNGTRTYTVVK